MSISSIPPGSDPYDPPTFLLRPVAGSPATPPEDLEQELKMWDALLAVMQAKRALQLRSVILAVTGKRNIDEVMMTDSAPEDDYYRDL